MVRTCFRQAGRHRTFANGMTGDAIISCQMIGVYKPNPDAYQTAVRWLGTAPEVILLVACHHFAQMNARLDSAIKLATRVA